MQSQITTGERVNIQQKLHGASFSKHGDLSFLLRFSKQTLVGNLNDNYKSFNNFFTEKSPLWWRNFFVFLNCIRVLQSNPISGRSMHILLFPDNFTYILYIHDRG